TRTPDGIAPGQCADASFLPASAQPGGGAQCSTNQVNPAGNSVATAAALCPAFAANPTGPFPKECASFDQVGFRVPVIAVSPFSKAGAVSHNASATTPVRWLSSSGVTWPFEADSAARPHLSRPEIYSDIPENTCSSANSPSLNTAVGTAAPPVNDCGPFS